MNAAFGRCRNHRTSWPPRSGPHGAHISGEPQRPLLALLGSHPGQQPARQSARPAPPRRNPGAVYTASSWLRCLRSRRPDDPDDSADLFGRHVSAVRWQLQGLTERHWVGFVGHGGASRSQGSSTPILWANSSRSTSTSTSEFCLVSTSRYRVCRPILSRRILRPSFFSARSRRTRRRGG
jgi:hypothetical protein